MVSAMRVTGTVGSATGGEFFITLMGAVTMVIGGKIAFTVMVLALTRMATSMKDHFPKTNERVKAKLLTVFRAIFILEIGSRTKNVGKATMTTFKILVSIPV
jgi:putative Ca2+/H+ antiporter (TMEM165/GDT1 family)